MNATTSRRITQDSKRRGQRGSKRPPRRLLSAGLRRHHRYRFSPSHFLFSSWTRFAFLRSLSWLLRCIAPHSQSCLVDLCAVHALWKVRTSVVWFHLQQFFVQARASMPVDLPAFNILHSCHKNRNSHRSPQSPPTSKLPPKWARDSFFHHPGSSPLLSTCRHVEVSAVDVRVVLIGFFFSSLPSSSHAKPLLWVVVLPQCAEIAAYVLFPYLGGFRNISLATSGTSRRTNPWSTCSEARRLIITPPTSVLYASWRQNHVER